MTLSAYALVPGGQYTFRLSCVSSSGVTAFAAVTVDVYPAPTPGYFSVSPLSGTFFGTTFTYTASYWTTVPSAYPLSYTFGFVDSLGNNVNINAMSASTSLSTYLPPGEISGDYMLTCYCVVSDVHHTTTLATATVRVTPSSSSTSLVNSIIENLFSSATESQDVSGLIATTALTSQYLNAVNCTGAPSCSLLNRQRCALRDHTCGDCYAGYAGAVGAKNDLCYSLSDRKMLLPDGTSCNRNSQCLSGICVNSSCSTAYKSCPNECSSNGSCQVIKSSTRKQYDGRCSVGDPTCEVVCVCFSGFSGSFCQYDKGTFSKRLKLRSSALAAFSNTSA